VVALDAGGDGGQGVGASTGEDDVEAEGGEAAGEGLADAGAGAGDQSPGAVAVEVRREGVRLGDSVGVAGASG
jgi:hypothetical protein